jgi:hypothetical protein
MTEQIAKLKRAIETMHDCAAHHVGSQAVIELFEGEVAWDGVVAKFQLVGHPKARYCYAWSYVENEVEQYVIILESPPVDSAEMAVKIAIAAQAKGYAT